MIFLRKSLTKNVSRLVQVTAKKKFFLIKAFFNKCDQSRRKLHIPSRLLKESLMVNFMFYAVTGSVNNRVRIKSFLLSQFFQSKSYCFCLAQFVNHQRNACWKSKAYSSSKRASNFGKGLIIKILLLRLIV